MRLAAAALTLLLASACTTLYGLGEPAQEDLSTWSPVPLEPDPALTAQAEQQCDVSADGVNRLPFLLQDRRTAQSAIVMFGNRGEFAMCSVSRGSGGGFASGGAGIGGNVGPMTAWASDGRVGNSPITVLEGEVARPVAGVRVVRADGMVVEASYAGGRWLAWWPGSVAGTRAIAYDVGGASVLEVPVEP